VNRFQINLETIPKTTDEYIEFYIQEGFSPVPVKYKSKRLNFETDEWNLSTKPKLEDIRRWQQEGRYENIGLLVGPPGNNLTVIDIDKPDYIPHEILQEQLTYNDKIIGYLIKTHRGYQLWFKNKPTNYDRVDSSPDYGIEYFPVKHMVVAPPSIHKKGTPYQFIVTPEYFRETDVHFIYNSIKLWCIAHDIDYVLKPIMNPLIKEKIVDHLKNSKCGHNDRLWTVGFLYRVLNLEKKHILELIDTYCEWSDYNSKKTESYVDRQLRYIDKKVGENRGVNDA